MSEPEREPQQPSAEQIAATIAVLGEDHVALREAARRRLLAWGETAIEYLRLGAEAEQVRVRTNCRAVLRSIEIRDLLARFARLRLDKAGRNGASPLLDGAMLAAQMVRTFVPRAPQVAARLRREAVVLKRECEGRSLPTCARLLAERLHDRLGMRGVGDGEVEVDHVLLDRVLQRGVGAPVSLSIVYLLVARWAGLSACGVALPDHFLVRLHGPRPVLVDPFHGGRSITKADCARYLRARGHDRVGEHLRDLGDREVLIHYLRCLRRAAARSPAPEAQTSLGEALARLESS